MHDARHTTREKILEAALILFSKKGFLGAATKEIAAEAGVAEVTLFRHFSTKDALLEETLTSYMFLPTLKEIMPSVSKLPYEEALSEMARKYIEILTLRRDFIRILHSERHLYSEKILKTYRSMVNDIFLSIAGYLAKKQKEGVLRKFDTLVAARAFIGMFFSYFSQSELLMLKKNGPRETEAFIREYVRIFMRGTVRERANNSGSGRREIRS
jgi:AcrR family transcriptional regulator